MVFKARGKYAKINTKVVMNELGSRKSLEIKGDTSWSQIYTHESFFVGDYQELQVGFWYSSVNAAAGDSFGVEISSDNGNTWDTVHDYSRDKEWPSDKIWYNGTKEFKKPDGAQWITLRIMAAVKSKGALYFENVSLEGR